jgi:hypothetical protein
MNWKTKPLSEQTAVITGGRTGIGRVFNLCPGLVDVENTAPDAPPRPGFVHVSNMAKTLLYVLSLDRNVVLEDVNIYAR